MDEPGQPTAIYFDGQSSRKRHVTLQFDDALTIIEDGAPVATWPFADIRRADGPPDKLRLMCVSALPLARLEIAASETQQAIIARAPLLDAREARQTGRIVGWSLVAAASIVLLVMYGIPFVAERLALLVPRAAEARIGDVAERQMTAIFGKRLCTTPEGSAALQKLVDKLAAASGLNAPVKAQAVLSFTPNAFALPGGNVYVLSGLLDRANHDDEVAGVLAHEMGHIQHRDALRVLIRNGGSSYVIGLLFGDVFGSSAALFATRSLFDSAYSRDVERDADNFAMTTMRALGRSPKPMAELLVRITKQFGGGAAPNILASHPMSEERLATMSRDDRPVTGEPLLTNAEWQALKSICNDALPKPRR